MIIMGVGGSAAAGVFVPSACPVLPACAAHELPQGRDTSVMNSLPATWQLVMFMLLWRQGVEYTQSMVTGWKPPARIRRLAEDDHQAVRDKFHIITEGDHLVPPLTSFQDFKFPPAVLRQLASKGIQKPTPIQMQVGGGGRHLATSPRHPLVVPAHCLLHTAPAPCCPDPAHAALGHWAQSLPWARLHGRGAMHWVHMLGHVPSPRRACCSRCARSMPTEHRGPLVERCGAGLWA